MSKKIYVDGVHPEETRVVVVDTATNRVSDFDVETTTKPQIKGNIYLAKVIRVEPSLQAAFVDYGTGKNGFLPFSEIHPDYYQVTPEQKKKLIELAHANIVDDDDDPNDEEDEVAEYDDHGAGYEPEVHTELFAFERFFDLPEQQKIEHVEINAEQYHEDGDYPLNIRREA